METREGEVQSPMVRERLFRTLDAMLDFISLVNIHDGSFTRQLRSEGAYVWCLTYPSSSGTL